MHQSYSSHPESSSQLGMIDVPVLAEREKKNSITCHITAKEVNPAITSSFSINSSCCLLVSCFTHFCSFMIKKNKLHKKAPRSSELLHLRNLY